MHTNVAQYPQTQRLIDRQTRQTDRPDRPTDRIDRQTDKQADLFYLLMCAPSPMLSETLSDNKQSIRYHDRQTGRADRADKQTHRQTKRLQIDIQTIIHTDIQTDIQTDRPTASQSTRQIERGVDKHTDKADADRQTDKQTNRTPTAFARSRDQPGPSSPLLSPVLPTALLSDASDMARNARRKS